MDDTIIWTMEFCPECEDVKGILKSKGIGFHEKCCKDFLNGQENNFKAIRFFVKNDKTAPIIWYKGCLYNSKTFKDLMKSNE